ncbi:MAG TPA: GTP 3',8-cyclase MoaA, partial [Amycolatopsis sp.]|nr:GTP 3',8-cyclase MoaA [Amycolatopsis sp.]
MSAVNLGLPRVRGSHHVSEPRPDNPALIDTFGRVATDLRVSLTDRCNLRCTYCMPAEGLPWLPGDEVLSDAELLRLLRIAVGRLGVTDIRLTGGEPLLRPGLEELVARIAELRPRPRLSMTTNGIGLAKRAKAIAEAGLDRINVSLDSVNPATFRSLTRRDRLSHVLAGLAAAREAGLDPVKVNAVLLRGVNEHEATDLLRFCVDHGYHLRFIEQMPLDAQHGWNRADMVTAEEILGLLRTEFSLTPSPARRGGAPAERWLVDGGPADVGVIASVTRPFCSACERTRLTADG